MLLLHLYHQVSGMDQGACLIGLNPRWIWSQMEAAGELSNEIGEKEEISRGGRVVSERDTKYYMKMK